MVEFVAALLPRIALPCRETRALVPLRDIILRFVVARDAFATVPRDTTLRPLVVAADGRVDTPAVARDADTLGRADVAVARDAVVAVARDKFVARDAFWDTVARDTVPREETVRDDTGATVAVAAVPRDTVFAAVRRDVVVELRGDAVPARVAWGPVTIADVATGAIGSANTARRETNVEHTKNAPANKNTVPIAFLKKSAKLRLFIKLSLYSGNARKTRCLTM